MDRAEDLNSETREPVIQKTDEEEQHLSMEIVREVAIM